MMNSLKYSSTTDFKQRNDNGFHWTGWIQCLLGLLWVKLQASCFPHVHFVFPFFFAAEWNLLAWRRVTNVSRMLSAAKRSGWTVHRAQFQEQITENMKPFLQTSNITKTHTRNYISTSSSIASIAKHLVWPWFHGKNPQNKARPTHPPDPWTKAGSFVLQGIPASSHLLVSNQVDDLERGLSWGYWLIKNRLFFKQLVEN